MIEDFEITYQHGVSCDEIKASVTHEVTGVEVQIEVSVDYGEFRGSLGIPLADAVKLRDWLNRVIQDNSIVVKSATPY